jgi:hypothetical protein
MAKFPSLRLVSVLLISILIVVGASFYEYYFENPLAANLVVFGIGLLGIFIFEVVKRPSLDICLQPENIDIPDLPNGRKKSRLVHLKAVNRPIYENWIQRSTATNCRSKITVKDEDGNVLQADRNVLHEIGTKWAATPQPLRLMALPIAGGAVLQDVLDESLIGQCDKIDIYANYEGQLFAVAVKIVDDSDCYLFRGESYISQQQWRLPKYKIPSGTYTLEVYVEADNGKSKNKTYRLHNVGTNPEDLTLEPV